MSIIKFGLSDEFNFKLVKFLPADVLSKLPLNEDQIDTYSNLLNWDIMSSKQLPGRIFVKYAERIDWNAFLRNGKPKEINYLLDVVHKLEENRDVFFDVRIKKLYYNTSFILVFPQFIDWKWCCKNVKLDDYVICKFWNKLGSDLISKHQPISDYVAEEKKEFINWKVASRNPLSETVMTKMKDNLNWDLICRKQKLSIEFLKNHTDYINWEFVAQYQSLTMEFISKYIRKLPSKYISKYQDLTIEFIKQYSNILDFDSLTINKYFNKPDSIQIVKSSGVWFVIEPPMLDKFTDVNFASCEVEVKYIESNTESDYISPQIHHSKGMSDYFDSDEFIEPEIPGSPENIEQLLEY